MNLAIIGAGPFQKPLVEEAKRLGYKTHVFAWEKGADAKAVADFFYPISILEHQKILEVLKKLKIDGVLSIASEVAVPTVAFLAQELNLVGNSISCAKNTLDKILMKKKFIENRVSCSNGFELEMTTLDRIDPLDFSEAWVVKPSDRSGSLAVEKVWSVESAKKAAVKAIEASFSKKCVIENFLNGDEFSAEMVSFQGTHKLVAVTKKSTTGAPYFVETAHYMPAPLTEDQLSKVKSAVITALNALEITNGISHAEFRINGDKISMIEVGGRMGGDYIGTHLVPLSTGINFLEVAIAISTNTFNWNMLNDIKSRPVGVNFINTTEAKDEVVVAQPKTVLSREIIEQSLDCEVGQVVKKTASSCTRYGYVIYRGEEITRGELLAHFGVNLK